MREKLLTLYSIMENPAIISNGSIEQPRLWRLALQLDKDALQAVVWSTVEDSTLVHFSLPLDPTLPKAKALEEAVYAAPVLLSDFGSVDVVVRTNAYMPVPQGLDEDTGEALMEYACLSAGSNDVIVKADRAAAPGMDVLWALDAGVSRFLARTFRNPATCCHASVLLRYFSRKSVLGNSGKTYAHLHRSGVGRDVDIVVIGNDGSPAIVTTHRCTTDEDAVYHILGSALQAGLDLRSDEILLCGSASDRDALMPLLRRYAACVMPVIFPSAAFRNGREALTAPFPLVILPLCE